MVSLIMERERTPRVVMLYAVYMYFQVLEHHVYDAVRGNLMERFVQYVKDRTEGFDDYFPCRRERCRFEHVKGWLSYYMLSFNLFKRRDVFKRSPILLLTQVIRGPKDPP